MQRSLQQVIDRDESDGDITLCCNYDEEPCHTILGRVHSQILSLASPILAVAIECAKGSCNRSLGDGIMELEVGCGPCITLYHDRL